MFATPWFMTVFLYNLPFEIATRIWDLFLQEGYSILYCVSLALLTIYEDRLLELKRLEQLLWFLQFQHNNLHKRIIGSNSSNSTPSSPLLSPRLSKSNSISPIHSSTQRRISSSSPKLRRKAEVSSPLLPAIKPVEIDANQLLQVTVAMKEKVKLSLPSLEKDYEESLLNSINTTLSNTIKGLKVTTPFQNDDGTSINPNSDNSNKNSNSKANGVGGYFWFGLFGYNTRSSGPTAQSTH